MRKTNVAKTTLLFEGYNRASVLLLLIEREIYIILNLL